MPTIDGLMKSVAFLASSNRSTIKQSRTHCFAAAKKWLIAEGMTSLRGPANPSLNYECGLLVECFDLPPTFMMSYNKPYLRRPGRKKLALVKSQDLLAFWGKMEMLAQIDPKLFFIAQSQSMERFNITIRPMNTKKFAEELQLFLHIYNDSMLRGTWGFVPLSKTPKSKSSAKGLKVSDCAGVGHRRRS